MNKSTQLDFLKKIQTQSVRLSTLVSDLMTISRLETSHQTNQSKTINLNALLYDAIHVHKPACEEKQISLDLQATDHFVIAGDQQSVRQVIDNLLDNAIKYTNTDGSIEACLAQYGPNVKLSVKDTGVGIEHKHKQRIFERFYRVDKARSKELGGTGLGLSIVKNIVEQHGGSVSVDSHPGAGSCFIVLLPLMKN